MLPGLCITDFGEPGPRLFANTDHLKHTLDQLISAVTDPPFPEGHHGHTEQARVNELKNGGFLKNPDAARASIIRMNQCIRKGF